MPAKDTVALDDDVELRTVALASPLNRTMVKDALYTEETIETAKGKVLVAFAGDRKKPAILTYHDLGLNYISNFQAREKTAYIYTRNKYPKPSLSTQTVKIAPTTVARIVNCRVVLTSPSVFLSGLWASPLLLFSAQILV